MPAGEILNSDLRPRCFRALVLVSFGIAAQKFANRVMAQSLLTTDIWCESEVNSAEGGCCANFLVGLTCTY